MTRIIIVGSKGRMGQALLACAPAHPKLQVTGQVDAGEELGAVIEQGDVIIDFSSHLVTPGIARQCAECGKALVIGTTGHNDTETFEIRKYVENIPIVWSSNYSTG